MPIEPRTDPITDLDAHALSSAIHARQLSCREVMQATLARIHCLNPHFNAIVNLAGDALLLKQADERDAELAPGPARTGSRGFLHGIPQAIKDTGHALGFPSTLGSPLLHAALPAADSLYVARMKAAGCIVIGKTNMPELGLGSHTYNALFGATGNAWDAGLSAGGSSGGAAVCLAQRLLALADGSDFMGSLRQPAGWNHVFGLRPSAGRVPAWPKPELFVSQLGTDGPMARHVRDLAKLLSIQAGHDARAPLSMAQGPQDFVPGPDVSARGVRIGWLGDLGGHLAMAPGILQVCEQALSRLAGAGAEVEPTALGFDADRLWQAWLVWRGALVAPSVGALLSGPGMSAEVGALGRGTVAGAPGMSAVAGAPSMSAVAGAPGARVQIKAEALWEYDQALGLSCNDFMAAAGVRSAFYSHLLTLFERFDVLALPSAQTWPFDLHLHWPREVAGRAMDSYHRWMEVTLYATFAGLPAISVPAGFEASGRLPMGLQLIGRPHGDAELLRVAAAYEECSQELLRRRPAEPG